MRYRSKRKWMFFYWNTVYIHRVGTEKTKYKGWLAAAANEWLIDWLLIDLLNGWLVDADCRSGAAAEHGSYSWCGTANWSPVLSQSHQPSGCRSPQSFHHRRAVVDLYKWPSNIQRVSRAFPAFSCDSGQLAYWLHDIFNTNQWLGRKGTPFPIRDLSLKTLSHLCRFFEKLGLAYGTTYFNYRHSAVPGP